MNKLIIALAATLATIATVGTAGAQTLTPSAAAAAADFKPHAYIGIAAATAGDNNFSDDYRVSPKIFGGYEFTPNWGVEAGYTELDKQNRSIGMGDGVAHYTVKGSNSYVAGKYTLPVTDRFGAYAKLGVSYNERKGTTSYGSWTGRDTGLYGGLGVQYKLTEHVSALAEYERYGKDKEAGAKADTYTVGLKYGF